MADSKITALAALTAADPVNDMFPVVDVSDTSMAASGTTKRISVNNILGASGTATLASATITGALTVDTTTLVVDATNDRVGIGTATPTQALSVGGAIDFKSYVAHMDNFAVYAHTTDGTIVSSFAGYPICFRIANVEVGRINTTANLVLKGGTAAANGVGVTFPATQVASSDANCLDDYEEGTWTGTLTGGTTNPTIPVTATGRYTKIGRVVTVQITFNNVNTLGASGLLGITGLPFANNASVNSVGSVNFYNIATFTGSPFVALGTSQSSLVCYSNISNSAFADVTHNAGPSVNYFTASITYTV